LYQAAFIIILQLKILFLIIGFDSLAKFLEKKTSLEYEKGVIVGLDPAIQCVSGFPDQVGE
jgi:hypothetical protein